MYKLVAIDLDGTMLQDNLEIAQETIEAVQQASEKGAIVTIATGRMLTSAKQFAEQLKINAPIITYQGAIIHDLETEKVLYERTISPEISRQILQFAEEKNVHLQVYQDDKVYGKEENEILLTYAEKTKVPYYIEPDLYQLAARGLTKAIFIDEPSVLEGIVEELATLVGETTHITKSTQRFLELTHSEANKGHALTHLAKTLGIEQSQTIGIGDNFNDKELITTAGLGVAMGNAVNELKDLADFVTLSNNEHGVKHVLEKFILNPSTSLT